MTLEILAVATILGAMVYCFFTEKLPLDFTALAGLLLLSSMGLVPSERVFSGFSSPVVITLLCMFVVSAGLRDTGLAERLALSLRGITNGRIPALVALVTILAAFFSAFMANIAAAALLLPAVMALAAHSGVSPSKLLIPLCFGTVLGGMTTLIGTAPNMMASDILQQAGFAPLQLLDFFWIGAAAAVLGVLLMARFADSILPSKRLLSIEDLSDNLIRSYHVYDNVFCLKMVPGCDLAGKTIDQTELGKSLNLQVLAINRGGERILSPRADELLKDGDILVVGGSLTDYQKLSSSGEVNSLVRIDNKAFPEIQSSDIGLCEVVLSPRSRLIGSTLRELNFRERYDSQVLSIWRGSGPLYGDLGSVTLGFGDALLLQGPRLKLGLLFKDKDFLAVTRSLLPYKTTARSIFVVIALALMILLPAFNLLPVHFSAFLAAMLVVACGAVSMQEVYREMDWRMIVFVAALLPLGTALQQSGGAEVLSQFLIQLAGQHSPLLMMVVLGVASSFLSQILDGALAVIVLGPVAVKAAEELTVSPYPLVMSVAFCASVAFLTPFSHKANLFVMGVGEYKTKDYFRLGFPLTLIVMFTVFLLVPWVFPF